MLLETFNSRKQAKAVETLWHTVNGLADILQTSGHQGLRGFPMLAGTMGFHVSHAREVLAANVACHRVACINLYQSPLYTSVVSRAVMQQPEAITELSEGFATDS